MGVSCREEFQCRNFCFEHTKPYKFIRSEWRISQETYILWRLFWALWHIEWLTFSIQRNKIEEQPGERLKWLIYLTNLSYSILTVQSWLHTGIICYFYVFKKNDSVEENIQWYLKILWLLTTLAFDIAIVVTVLYWTLVFEGVILTFLTVATHAINSVYVVSDIFVIGSPVRLLHLIYPMMYGSIYICFSYIYHVYGGTNQKSEPFIYKSLDWSKPHSAAIVAAGSTLVALPLIHLLQFGLYALRLRIVGTSKCSDRCGNLDRNICEREDSSQTKMGEDVTNGCVHTLVEMDPKNKTGITSSVVKTSEITAVA